MVEKDTPSGKAFHEAVISLDCLKDAQINNSEFLWKVVLQLETTIDDTVAATKI